MMEQVMNRLNGGNSSAPSRTQPAYVMKLIEQVINRKLKLTHFNTQMAAGETIPDGCMIATYEKVPVERYQGNRARAFLPAIPISLPRNMGIFAVRPHISNEYLKKNQLSANPYSSTVINCSWTGIEFASGYILERAKDLGFTQNLTQMYSGPDLFFTDNGASPSTTYFYRVKGFNADYIDSDWVVATATTLQDIQAVKLGKPVIKTQRVDNYFISLSWSTIPNAQNYIVERSTDSNFPAPEIVYYGPNAYYTDNGLTADTMYYYRITAVASGYINSDSGYHSQKTNPAGIFDNSFDETFN